MNRMIFLLFLWGTSALASVSNVQSLSVGGIDLGNLRIFVGQDSTQKKNSLDALKVEYTSIVDKFSTDVQAVEEEINAIKKRIDGMKQRARTTLPQHQELYAKELSYINKIHQSLLDIKESRMRALDIMKQHIEFLETYFENPESVLQEIPKKSLYAFSDLYTVTKYVYEEEDEIARISVKKQELEDFLSKESLDEKEKEKRAKEIDSSIENLRLSGKTDISYNVQVLDVAKEVNTIEQRLIRSKINEYQRSVDFIDSKLFVYQECLKTYKNTLGSIHAKLRISKEDIALYEQSSVKVKKSVDAKKLELNRLRTELSHRKMLAQEELDKMSLEHKVQPSQKIFDQVHVDGSYEEMYASYLVALAQTAVINIDRESDYVKAQIEFENAKEMEMQLMAETVQTMYAISHLQLHTTEQLEEERKYYKGSEKNILHLIKKDKDHIDQMHEFVKHHHKAIYNLRMQRNKIASLPARHFASSGHEKQQQFLYMLDDAIKKTEEQNERALALSELYAHLIEVRERSLVTIKFILQEIENIGVWQRSNRAVTWNGIKHVIPTFILFVQTLQSVLGEYIYSWFSFSYTAYAKSISITSSLYFGLLLFCLLMLFFFMQLIIPYLYQILILQKPESYVTELLKKFAASVVGFWYYHDISLYAWACTLLLTHLYTFSTGFLVLFYVMTSVYLVYVSRTFLQHFLDFNKKADYVLLSPQYQERFAWVFSFFTVSTITILMLRKLFVLVMLYQQSEFPTILLRLYHIVVFISLIFTIDKDEVLNLLPDDSSFGRLLSGYVDQYYYFLLFSLLAFLIITDPYLGGYGGLVWYLIWNVFVSALILFGLLLVNNFIKTIGSNLFFKSDEEAVRVERFKSAKTYYGLFVAAVFVVLSVIGFVFVARVWGHLITWFQIKSVLNKGVFVYNHYLDGGQIKAASVTVLDLLKIIFITVSGVYVSKIFNRFVLQRVFVLQYVEPSLQNALTTISHYLIVTTSIMGAFIYVDLTFLVWSVLGVVALVLGWSFKDFFTDFVAYFFILIQRPLKIGDYIKINDEIMGVVRKISPRAVILRRKNSLTIVVPNSLILKESLHNWNYTKSFVAFDDITLTVPYSCDPEQVRQLIYKVLDQHPEILKMPNPIIRLDEFSERGYTFIVRAFVSSANTLQIWDIASDVRFGIVKTLGAQGIKLAEPVMNVFVKNKETLFPHSSTKDLFPEQKRDGVSGE